MPSKQSWRRRNFDFGSIIKKAYTGRSYSNFERILCNRGYSRRLTIELLEDRRLLAATGLQILDVDVTGYPGFNIFETKPTASHTPLVNSLTISVVDQPNRAPDFLGGALNVPI